MISIAKCWHYEAIDKADKVNCINCIYWTGKRCKDEALLLADEEKEHGWAERMMRGNRGVWLK